MKLYSYSSELYTFVEAKWALAKLATGGFLLGAIILYGVIQLNQSVDHTLGSRSATTLTAENDILRQQLSLISPRMSKLEMEARQFNERADRLHILLHPREIAGDRVSNNRNTTKGSKLQSLIVAAKSLRP